MIGVFLIVFGLGVRYLIQSNAPITSISPGDDFRGDDRLIQVITPVELGDFTLPVQSQKPISGQKESIYAYDEQTPDFRFVCQFPCNVSRAVLDQEFAALSYALATVRGITQSDIDDRLLPFEVHATEDDVCRQIPGGLAYAYTSYRGGRLKAYLCFFFDVIEYDRSNFPYSTSMHEVTHLFEYLRIEREPVIYEGLSEMLESFFVKGSIKDSFCWKGNKWYTRASQFNQGPHYVGGNLFFQLCDQYGFDYENLPELFNKIDDKGGSVSAQEFVDIVNEIVEEDTSHLFEEAGVI